MIILLSILIFLLIPGAAYSQPERDISAIEDPFKSYLPQEEEVIEVIDDFGDEGGEEEHYFPPEIVIEGVLWGCSMPMGTQFSFLFSM